MGTRVTALADDGWPDVGSFSADRVAISGHDHHVYVFDGSNHEYASYRNPATTVFGDHWQSLISARSDRWGDLQHLTMFVANKTTAVPEHYPLWRPTMESFAWVRLRQLCATDERVMFQAGEVPSNVRSEDWGPGWGFTDSHWSEFGCAVAAQDVLARWGMPALPITVSSEPHIYWGDLGGRWPGPHLREQWNGRPTVAGRTPRIVSDNGEGGPGAGVVGRVTEWECAEAHVDGRLLIVGNSFGGPGLKANELSYWLARAFRSVVFIHSGDVPPDAIELFAPDALLFQTVERFLSIVPSDTPTVADLEARFAAQGAP